MLFFLFFFPVTRNTCHCCIFTSAILCRGIRKISWLFSSSFPTGTLVNKVLGCTQTIIFRDFADKLSICFQINFTVCTLVMVPVFTFTTQDETSYPKKQINDITITLEVLHMMFSVQFIFESCLTRNWSATYILIFDKTTMEAASLGHFEK